jgi:hypothetical protein
MRRRSFVGFIGAVASAVLGGPGRVAADRVRILPPASADAGGPLLHTEAIPVLGPFLDAVRIGPLRAHGSLAVLWLTGPPAGALLDVATLDEARARGDLILSELPQAAVPAVVADNRARRPVLLLAGEIVLGGKQNRVVAEDVLLPPASGPRQIAVYCVEQGRWAGTTKDFSSQGALAASRLRSEIMARAPQAQVWSEVSRSASRLAAASPTGSYQAVLDKPEVQAYQQDAERALDRTAPAATSGAAVFTGERLLGVDLFHDPALFAREWPKLLRAHALETYGSVAPAKGDEPRLRARLAELVRLAARAEGTRRPTPGSGALYEFRVDRARGTAVIADAQVVHAAML